MICLIKEVLSLKSVSSFFLSQLHGIVTSVPGVTQIPFSDTNTILHRVAVNSTTGGVGNTLPGVNLPIYSSVEVAGLLISVKGLCYP